MYSAFLRTGDTWRRESNPTTILNHDGECVICDTREDEAEIGLTLTGMEPERFVTKSSRGSTWVVTDYPYDDKITDELIETLEQTSKVIVGQMDYNWVRHSHKNRVYYVAGLNATRRDFIIAEKDENNDTWVLTKNPDLWAIANKKVDNLRKKRVVKIETAKVTHPEVQSLGGQLMYKAGFQVGNAGPRNLIAGIILMDELKGKEKTNEEITEIAAKWLKYKAENTAKFLASEWLSQKDLERLNKRFEEIHPPEEVPNEENPVQDETTTA
jgi:hypothetical protein